MTLREALSALRERRPIVWPNEGFVASLISLENSLLGINSLKVKPKPWPLLLRYVGTSLIRNRHPVGPYSRTMPRLLGLS